ncbi:MAG: alpha/beta fold hydrolase [bacterium]
MKNLYNHVEIEKKWQEKWQEQGLYKVQDSVSEKENFYQLVEFSYPSGNLHVGHWYAFSVPDIFARYKRMQGFNVLYPMGFDAFGLPAENAAIKFGGDPMSWTYKQMDVMREQLKSMGAMFDWDKEIVSCAPEYYKWTQWMFTQFLKKDLVYRAVTKVNWCPKDQTILANEQVVDNKCERCGSEVIQRDQEQWMLRITKYADRLIDDLDTRDWPHAIKESQKNWIGRSEGSEIDFSFTKKYTYVLLHGFQGSPNEGKYAWLKEELEKRGHTVVCPVLPNTNSPKEIEQVATALDAVAYDENTIVWGHSLGSVVAMKVLEKITKPIAGLILSGAFCSPDFEEDKIFKDTFTWDFDVKKIKSNTGFIKIIQDTADDAITKKQMSEIETLLNVPTRFVKAELPHFDAEKEPELLKALDTKITVFTTRADTLFGVTYVVLAPEHALVQQLLSQIENKDEVLAYIADTKKKSELDRQQSKEKTGVQLKGVFVINPANNEVVPVWIADYVLAGYGTGAVMAVPMHDERDAEFASVYNLPVLDRPLVDKVEITNKVGGRLVSTYRLRDWGISRQRYWGTPIPIVYDPEGIAHPVPDEHLPWLLPTDVDHTPDGTAPLARSKELFERTEKIFGKGWKPEVETMDTFVDSSWYFYRYVDNKNNEAFASPEKMAAWMPLDLYMGGAEHTTMHLLYSRFWTKALYDIGLVQDTEAYTVRRNRGLILGPDGNKMSKSKGNVIDPDNIVKLLGADTVRMYLAFMGPYGVTTNYPWDPNGVVGVRRFLERVWKLQEKISDTVTTETKQLHKTIKKMTEDIEEFKFNTAISQMMILTNEWDSIENISNTEYKTLLQLLAPFAPHIAEELWYMLGNTSSIHLESWPKYDPTKIIDSTMTLPIQINGKLRGTIEVAIGTAKEEIEKLALENEKIQQYISGQQVKKIIVVESRVVNIVL